MATTVITAFNEFLSDTVNLKKSDTDNARTSRDWLIDQLNGFEKDVNSPINYPEIHIGFGSFARRTKIRPLDDIDLMFGLSAEGCTHDIHDDKIVMNSLDGTRLKKFEHADSATISSISILNHFKAKLQEISQYQKSEIKRNKQAVTLQLSTKAWNFDIVPCFKSTVNSLGVSYYLIPDGKGNWMKTDPRIDKERTTTINVNNNGNVLNVIRVVKYWQTTKSFSNMSSYLLETMILNYYANRNDCPAYVDLALEGLFSYLSFTVLLPVYDQKNIQGDINTLSDDERTKISSKFTSEITKIREARNFERDNEHEKSINKWGEIFGASFPIYG